MKPALRIAPAEWEVMNIVWERAPVAASEVAALLEERKQWSLATVRTLLRRLVDKGALAQVVEGKRYLYTPLISLKDCVRQESESFLERVLGRASSAAVLHLVDKAQLSREDIKELRRILRRKEK